LQVHSSTPSSLAGLATFAVGLALGGCQGKLEGSRASSGGGGDASRAGAAGLGSVDPGTTLPASDLEGVAATCDANAGASAEFAPLARLTRREYARSVKDLLGVDFPVANLQPDGIVGLFFANVSTPVSEAQVDEYRLAAEQIAESATVDVAALAGCAPETGEVCARSFLQGFGRRAFRRPLSAEEVDAYLAIFRVGAGRDGFRGGIRLVVTGMLESPSFLYRVEQSPRAAAGRVKLSGFEVAARLSYLITASTPDPALLDAAAGGALDTDAGLGVEAERLLASPAGESALGAFHAEWLKVSGLAEVEKDAALFPSWSDALKGALSAETAQFVSYVLGQGDGRFSTLLTAPFSVIDPILAPLYGVTAPAGAGRVDFDPAQRSGLLTQGAFLAVKAHDQQSSPVRRGIGLLQSVACINMPPPPPSVMVQEPKIDASATTRERFAAHSNNATCAACHTRIDPPGFAFESYDAVGQFRSTEAGKPIDTAVTLVNVAADVDGSYPNARAMLEHLAASKTAGNCYALQWFRYALKREPVTRDACTLKRALGAFNASQGGVKDLVRALASADAFRYGVKEAEP
jgi:Protein of unknown function (DUF1592)/Protein of unknown function (DUF1588)/Protein of unknown function (DUF1595)/Protein of unknown function (DUF1587)/Protein of unknown function (DUF1585)